MSFIFTDEEYEVAKRSVALAEENFAAERAKLTAAGYTEEAQKMLQTAGYTRLQMQKEDIEIYENLKSGKLPESFEILRLPRMLTCMRIASGLSREQLAERLHQNPKALASGEYNEYHGVSSRWVQAVINVLPVNVTIIAEDSNTGEELKRGEVGELRNIVESLRQVSVAKDQEEDYHGQYGISMGYAVLVAGRLKVNLTVKLSLTK